MGVSPVIIQSWMTMTLYRNNLGDDWGSPVKPFYLGPQLVRRVRQADFAPAGGTPATITQSDGQRLLKAREGSSSAEGMAKNLRWDMDGYGMFMGFINKSEDHWSFKVLHEPPFMARWGPAAMSPPARSRARRPGVAGLWSAMILSFCRWFLAGCRCGNRSLGITCRTRPAPENCMDEPSLEKELVERRKKPFWFCEIRGLWLFPEWSWGFDTRHMAKCRCFCEWSAVAPSFDGLFFLQTTSLKFKAGNFGNATLMIHLVFLREGLVMCPSYVQKLLCPSFPKTDLLKGSRPCSSTDFESLG